MTYTTWRCANALPSDVYISQQQQLLLVFFKLVKLFELQNQG
jgi:hypothetical protein